MQKAKGKEYLLAESSIDQRKQAGVGHGAFFNIFMLPSNVLSAVLLLYLILI